MSIRMRAVVALSAVALARCGEAAAPPPATPSPPPTPSTATAAGAMSGFLDAARSQDNARVATWLATPAEVLALDELVTVYSSFGSAGSGGPFWDVAKLSITGVTLGAAGHADVILSGDIVWCLGRAQGDPTAVCSALNGRPSAAHSYPVVQVDGRWKVDLDINSSSQLDHNPEASPTAGTPTSTPGA
jgi:hypothetical protein